MAADYNWEGGAKYTGIEERMYRALDTLGVYYVPQRRFGPYGVDAYLPDWAVALEADGCLWHNCLECGYANEHPNEDVHRIHRDWWLLDNTNVLVVHLWGHTLETDAMALATVRAALAPFQSRTSTVQGVASHDHQ